MRLLILLCAFSFLPAVSAAKTISIDDTSLSCTQIFDELDVLRATRTTKPSIVNKNTINAGANVATQAASVAGVGREASLIRSIFSLFSAATPSRRPSGGNADIETEKRIARLETVAEMKKCV